MIMSTNKLNKKKADRGNARVKKAKKLLNDGRFKKIMTSNIVSVSVLKERLINNQRSKDKPLFEESIYLIEIDLHEKEKTEILIEIKKLLEKVELTYKNENGEDISWKIYKIIDLFDNIYNLEVSEFPNEVYSRHLELPSGSNYQDILLKFYSDYVWEDN